MKTNNTQKHARHAPSSLGYKEICPAFYGKSGSNAASEEGTLLHAAMETDDFSKLTEDQAFICGRCRDYRDGELAKLNNPTVYREIKLSIAGGLTFGTADFVAIDSSGQIGILMDWKFGQGKVEDASTNAQGCSYGLGAFEKFPNLVELTVHFVQPRRQFISTHTYTRADVERMKLRIQTIIRKANARNKEENPGLQCCYCRKQATCKALRNVALPIASRYAGLAIPEELHPSNILDPRMMAHCLDCAKVLKEWIDSVNYHALSMALNGQEIPGFKLVSRAGRRSISDALAAYGAVRDKISPEDFIACCGSVSIDSLTSKFSEDAPRGQKQKSKEELLSRLSEDGVLSSGAPSNILKRS